MNKVTTWLKKYFIPHEHNEFKPHFLRKKTTLLVLLLILIIEFGFLVQIFVVFDKTSFLASVLPGVLTTLTNEKRAENNAKPLTENALLIKAAELKAQDMANNGYFAHTSPDGKTPWHWLNQVGYNYVTAGENLAINFFESQDVAEAWMNSPTHRANIVKQNYTEIGIGVASGTYKGSNTVFVAQFFGTPMPTAQIPATPSTASTTPTSAQEVETIPIKTTPKTITPKITPPITPTTTPAIIANLPPTNIQVLGEEAIETSTTSQNPTLYSQVKLFIQKILASPREYINYVYGGIGIFIILLLLLAVIIRKEFHHPVIVTRGLTVVAVVILLIFINTKIFKAEDTKVPTDNLTANVIAY